MIKVKGNSQFLTNPAIKEEISEENMNRSMRSDFDDESVFQEEGDNLDEVATTN